jgi:hypothetical protein
MELLRRRAGTRRGAGRAPLFIAAHWPPRRRPVGASGTFNMFPGTTVRSSIFRSELHLRAGVERAVGGWGASAIAPWCVIRATGAWTLHGWQLISSLIPRLAAVRARLEGLASIGGVFADHPRACRHSARVGVVVSEPVRGSRRSKPSSGCRQARARSVSSVHPGMIGTAPACSTHQSSPYFAAQLSRRSAAALGRAGAT